MGATARKVQHTQARQPARPALRLVRGSRRAPRSRARADASSILRISVVCMCVLALAGIARVALAANAAEGAVDAWQLRGQLKSERMVTRSLESDRSSLAAPSRVEAIACGTLNMCEPTQVSHLDLTPAPATETPTAAESPTPGSSLLSSLLATVLDLAADEADVLVVGDMGIGALR